MEEINLKDLFIYAISKIYIVIITFAIAILISVVNSEFIKKPSYSSYTTIVLTTASDNNEESSITQNDITINQKLVATYGKIIKSRRVLGQVIDNLELDMSVSELASKVGVSNDADTSLLKITVKSTDKEQAAAIANEIAKVFSGEIVEIYNIKNVSIIDEAIISNTPYNINTIKDAVIAGLVGIVLGCGIIFILFYFDTTIKNPDEVQDKIGLPLLGIVPIVGDTKNLKKIKKNAKRGK